MSMRRCVEQRTCGSQQALTNCGVANKGVNRRREATEHSCTRTVVLVIYRSRQARYLERVRVDLQSADDGS